MLDDLTGGGTHKEMKRLAKRMEMERSLQTW